ncbi:MFS transporter [Thermococcus indicus]|uniref:hypothetical protein n=1 Tax=Thermococcus indicus TaxID=2586643 RepID=UPI001F105044|nr:hypothetical protein [Thermococcus indicus]
MRQTLYRLHMLTSSLRIIGDAVESVALPWSLLDTTGSLVSIGGFALFTHLPWVILPPILGRTLDRTAKKVRLAFLALILQALLAVLIVPLSSNVWAFYLIVSGISALDILHRYYGFSLVASMTLDESELQGLNAALATVGNGGLPGGVSTGRILSVSLRNRGNVPRRGSPSNRRAHAPPLPEHRGEARRNR